MTEDASAPLARFAAELQYSDLPPDVVEAAKLHLLDTLGAAAAGSSAEGIDLLIDQLTDWGGKPEASILASAHQLPTPWAALANGAMIHAKEFEDVHGDAFVRPSGSVVSSLLASCEASGNRSGQALITGMAAGYELIVRIGRAIQGPISFTRSGSIGAFAAAATASNVLGLDAATTQHAMGIAYAQASTSIQAQLDGALVKKLHPGFGAKAGLIGAMLARRGLTGNINSLEGSYGYLNIYEPRGYDRDMLVHGLGNNYELGATGFKRFPSAIYTHAPIAGALRMQQRGLDHTRLRSVTVWLPSFAADAGAKPYEEVAKAPVVEAMFSVPYLVAAGLVRGTVGLDDLENEAVTDPVVADLARRVKVEVDHDIPAEALAPARLRAELTNGETLDETVPEIPGSSDDTPDWDEVVAKLRSCLRHGRWGWRAASAERIATTIRELDTLPDAVTAILDASRP